MGKPIPITLLKIGGSLITHKDRALSLNNDALNRAVSAVAKSGLPSGRRKLIIVHGGGSFGHYYAKKFGLSVDSNVVNPLAISITMESMMQLHAKVLRSFVKARVPTETIMAQDLVSNGSSVSSNGMERLSNALALNLVPISFGNVASSGKSARIVSGDAICEAIVRSMPVDRMIFAMDVDGIYQSPKLRKFLKIVTREASIKSKTRKFDVSGGIQSKIALGFGMADTGTEVFYVNGKRPERLLKLLRGVQGSKVRASAVKPTKRRES